MEQNTHQKYWKKFESNDPTIALDVFYEKEMEKCMAYISIHNSTRQKQIYLLIIRIAENKGWYYLAVKKLSALLYGSTSKQG